MRVFRPLIQSGSVLPDGAFRLLEGPFWFTHAEELKYNKVPVLCEASKIPVEILERMTKRPLPRAGLSFDEPRVMGVLNLTPDSFSDGGKLKNLGDAVKVAQSMVDAGADILDIGGESTRPGAKTVPVTEEIQRIQPLILELVKRMNVKLSIDTRKAQVAEVAIGAGMHLVNDVSGFKYDNHLAPLCAQRGVSVCLMHSSGEPETMQQKISYQDVVLDVYAFFEEQIDILVSAGIARDQIIIDPGIGFGKTTRHNLALIQHIATFHGLGCPILLGVSRKGFIGEIGNEPQAIERWPGSIAVGLKALDQGVQILRVHDVSLTRQALRLWQALN
ncbi:MAG: dihydropteroate synthase [Aestuariivita sp.]|nr:dihydropteroate synthase [Aestuariivita sp.]